jgi:hypothetical protein
MGFRIDLTGAEETYRPQGLANLVPTWSPEYAFRSNDRQERTAAARAQRAEEQAKIIPNALVSGVDRFYEQGDRQYRRAESEQQMRLRERQGALTEEQIKDAQFQRGLDEKYGERKAELGLTEAEKRMDLTAAQLEQAGVQTQALKSEQAFLDQDAAAAGITEARPGETVRGYQLRTGVENVGLDREVKLAQIAAQKDAIAVNKVNAEMARFNLDEGKRSARVRDMVARLSTVEDPQQSQAIISDIAKNASPAEFAEAQKTVAGNRLQSRMMQEEMARRDPNFGYVVGRMQEASEAGSQLAALDASMDNAARMYGKANTPWSDEAEDAVKEIQAQLVAAGYTKQAEDLETAIGSGLDILEPRSERLKKAINQLRKTVGSQYEAKYGHLGNQYKTFGQNLRGKGFGFANMADGKPGNVFLGQGGIGTAEVLQAPMPSQLGTGMYQTVPGFQQPQQTFPVNQQTQMPWMGGQQQPMQQPMQPQAQPAMPQQPQAAPQQPQIQLPPSFKATRKVAQP